MPYTYVEDLGDLLRSCQRQLCCPTRNLCHLCCSICNHAVSSRMQSTEAAARRQVEKPFSSGALSQSLDSSARGGGGEGGKAAAWSCLVARDAILIAPHGMFWLKAQYFSTAHS